MSRFSDLYIEGYACLIFILSLLFPYAWLVFFLYLYLARKMIRIGILLVACFLITILYFYIDINHDDTLVNASFQITEIKHLEYNDLVTVKQGIKKYHIYLEMDSYEITDLIYIKGTVNRYRKQTIPNGFNAFNYHLSHGVYGLIEVEEVKRVGSTFSLFQFRESMINSVHQFESKDIILSLVFDVDQLDSDVKERWSDLGLVHLLSMSGLHLFLLASIIKKGLFYFNIKRNHQDIIIMFIYLVMMYVQGFSVSSVRLLMMQSMMYFNYVFKWRMTKLDLIQFVFFGMLILNIYYVYHVGFLITYLILNFLELEDVNLGKKEMFTKRYLSYLLVLLILLPFQQKISITSIVIVPLFSMFMIGPLFLLSLFTLFISEIDELLFSLYNHMIKLTSFLTDDRLILRFAALKPYEIMLYFTCLILVFSSNHWKQKLRRILCLVFILYLPMIKLSTLHETTIYFLDVGQGDSIFIKTPSVNILIDAFYQSDTFLLDLGIQYLDYLILTHSDEDHTLKAKSIIENIQVKKVILNPYDHKYDRYQAPISYMKSGDSISLKDIRIDFLSPLRPYDGENNNSLVFQIDILGQVFLFTGDIEEEVELDLMMEYGNQLQSDVIKIAHHGSDTSSSEVFIDYVNPKVAILSVGTNNRFGFPSEEVIQRLKNHEIEIYRTDQHGTIIYKAFEQRGKWSFLLPFSNEI